VRPTQLASRGDRAVAGADNAGLVHDHGLLLLEAGQRGHDGGEGWLGVKPDVGRVERDRVDGDVLDLHGRLPRTEAGSGSEGNSMANSKGARGHRDARPNGLEFAGILARKGRAAGSSH
jgi:hypothetical protein